MYKASSAIPAPVAKLLESLHGEIKDYAAVAEHLGVSSRSATCSVCQAYGCSSCLGCCLRYD
eukprot:4358037-Heterocapsa_arctica.AAC.1